MIGSRREMREVKLPDIAQLPEHLTTPASRMQSKEGKRRILLEKASSLEHLLRQQEEHLKQRQQ